MRTGLVSLLLTLAYSCNKLSESRRVNALASSLDYSCFTSLDSTYVSNAEATSIFQNDSVYNRLELYILTPRRNLDLPAPEDIVYECTYDLWNTMPSDFTSLRVDIQFGFNQSEVRRTKIVRDTMYYRTPGIGFPLDSFKID